MDRKSNLVLALAAAVLVGFFAWSRWPSRTEFDWDERFRDEKQQPYDLSVLENLLQNFGSKKGFEKLKKAVKTELPADGAGKNFVFVGEAAFLDSLDAERVLAFVRSGGTAFFSAKTMPQTLMIKLCALPCRWGETAQTWADFDSALDTMASLRFLDNSLKMNELAPFSVVQKNKPVPYSWHFLLPRFFCDSAQNRPLGALGDTLAKPRFFYSEWAFGDGKFLLHSLPVLFTNYFLVQKNGREQAEMAFSYLADGPVFWDNFSRTSEAVGRRQNAGYGRGDFRPEESPLRQILREPPLAWAWFTLIGMAVFFLIFRAKRRQRAIPVLPKNENTSLEFIQTLGQMSFRQQNHTALCQQKMRLFLGHVRDRYGMAEARPGKNFIEKLAKVSSVPLADVQAIFVQFSNIERYQPTEEMMIDFHRSIEFFHKKAS